MVFNTFILDVDSYGGSGALRYCRCRFGDCPQAITVFVVRAVCFVCGIFSCFIHYFIGMCSFALDVFWLEHMNRPNNSPEPTPITLSVPHSRLTVWAARLSF